MDMDGVMPHGMGQSHGDPAKKPVSSTTNTVLQHMLPTPVKTPRKKHTNPNALVGGGRVLFPDRGELEDPMPSLRKNKKGKRHVGFSLSGSMEDDDQHNIPIYTDSKDKVPDVDMSQANPFIMQPREEVVTPPEPTKTRSSRKRKVAFGLDGSQEVEDAFNREEGMVYVL